MTALLPLPDRLPPLILTLFTVESIGIEMVGAAGGNPTSGTWPTSNRAIYIPFSLRSSAVVRKLFWANGATASGNTDMGIYASTDGKPGALLVSTGSTAQAGTATLQTTDITDLPLQGGVLYYMALAHSNGTGTFSRYTNPSANIMTMIGACQATTAFPLAANPTIATMAVAYLPQIGLVFDTSAVL